jgi:very-short-patch-repair endonuclease
LTPKEREYFYKSIIDFVVFDQLGGYEPIYFIELDSVWHDLDKIEEKDKTKDRIFSLAGLKLIRIRHMANREIDEKTYLELIEDIRRQL